MGEQLKMTPAEWSWVCYDVGNSAFVLVMVTAIMPIFFKEYASAGMTAAVSTANWGFANSAASLILALVAPLLGAMADRRGRKKRYLTLFLLAGLLFAASLTLVQRGQYLLCLLLFVAARVGWAGTNIFYDAFIVDVTSRARMDLISARGYAWGYIGSVIPFLMVIGLLFAAGLDDGLSPAAAKAGFLVVAGWWLLFSLPLLRHVEQRYGVEDSATPFRDALTRLGATFQEIRRHRQVFLFLLAYFFYIDGVDTIITMSTAYGRDLGFGISTLIAVLLVIQLVAFPCALLYGRLARRFSSRSLLLAGIAVYSVATIVGFALPSIASRTLQTALFWGIALLVASSMGGIQALSRSCYARLIPAEKSAQFFGFYNIFGKFAAISGPLLMGVVSRATGHSRWGVLSILLLFLLGAATLLLVKEEE